jgi:PAS domain S-box-containing protein
MISATFGTLALSILSGKPFTVSTWYIWVAGDTVGALLASPVLLAISRHSLRALEHKKEILMFLILLVAANWFVFLSPYNYLRLSFVIVAMMIWAAMRFSLLTVSSITLALAIFSTWAASNNLGRFSSFEASGLVVVWAYVTTIALIALMINAMRSENAIASKKINETYQRLNKVTSRLPGLAIQYRVRSDKTTSIPYASIGILQMLEVSHQDVKDNAQQLIDRIDPRDVETARQQLAQATRELSPWQTEFRFYRLDGSVRWLFVDGLPEREADGAMLWHCFLSDITDRKQAERDLHIAACTFESQEGIFITDANWKILKVNQAFTRITGFTAEDMLGKRPRFTEAMSRTALFSENF